MAFTRPAMWEDVKTVARYLNEAGVDYTLVGSYAIAAHGFNRFSEDIDILVAQHITSTQLDDVTAKLLDLPGLLETKQGVRPNDQMMRQ